MAIALATLGKFEYIKGTDNAAYRLGIGGEGGTGGPKKKPQVTVSEMITEDNSVDFEIHGIEEEII